MNHITQICGAESVKDDEYFNKTLNCIIETREKTKKQLTELGFIFPDSKSNFIFASHNEVPAKYIFDELKKKKIYVRYWDKDKINNYLRITVGTDREMNILIEALREILLKGRNL